MYRLAEKDSAPSAVAAPPPAGPTEYSRHSAERPVAYIVSRFPLLTETFILREMLELERQGVKLELFPLLRARTAVRHAELEQLGALVHYTPFLSPAIMGANIAFFRRNPGRYVGLLWSVLRGNWGSANLFVGALGIFPKSVYFARLVEAHGIRHVHAHFATHPALSALIISELTGVSFSFTAHAHDIFLHERMLVEKAHKARFVVAISRYNKEYILSRAPNVASDNIRVVHCGVEPEKYQSRSSAPHPGLTAVCVASLQPYKGLKYLVQACHHVVRKVPGFRCLIVGEGADRAELEALIAKLDLGQAVELVGAKAQHEVTRILDEADLFVLPSVIAPSGQMDGIPVALMEAMACGLPVISTRLSGIPELIEDGKSGLLVEPADELVLADAITKLSEKPALRRAFGARAREKVGASFSLSANVDRLRSLFDEASSTAGAPDDLDPELLRWMKSALRSSNDAVLHCKRLGGGRDSEVFEVSAGTGHDPLILKLHRPNWARADEAINSGRPHAENEFRALTALRDAFAREPSNLRVPCPVGFMPEQAALLMEKCTGEKLGDKLRWARLRPGTRASLAGWFRDSGEWLATFHRVSARDGDSRAMFEKIETEFHADLQRCVRRGLSARLGSLARRRFEARKSASFDAVSGLVGRHCDFAPYNMLVSGDRITVIDFEGLRDGIAYEDLCYFLCMLETTPAYHLSRAAVASFRGEFLRGYERHTPLDDAALELFMVAAMANVMAHSPLLRPARGWIDTLKRRQKLRLFLRWFREELA